MTAREAAVQALLAYEKRGAWSSDVLGSLLEKQGLSRKDGALAYRICEGVLQNMLACDWYLQPYLRGSLQSSVRAILRCAVYQMAFMDKIPQRAAVNEAVELTKKLANPAAARLVNAVLRRLIAQPLPQLPDGTDAGSLSLRYSHPRELVELFLKECGPENTRAMLECNNRESRTVYRVNRLKGSREDVIARLTAEGYRAESAAPFGDFITVSGAGSPSALSAFAEGFLTVQDPAASLPVYAAMVRPGMRVLDTCAAPGGKSFLLAQEMANSGSILSCDLHTNKLKRIEEGARRLGIDIIRTKAADASAPSDDLLEAFDLVLADVPCSGMGVIGKKPEIRYKALSEIAGLPAVQQRILRGAARCVKPGGVLVYSTCTLLRQENEEIVDAFLAEHPDFTREAMELPQPFGRIEEGELLLWPHLYGTDGFYLCRMRRKT